MSAITRKCLPEFSLVAASFDHAVAACWQQATAEQLQNVSCVGGWQDVEWRSESATEEDEMLSVLFRHHCFYPRLCLAVGGAWNGRRLSPLIKNLPDLCWVALTRLTVPVRCRSQSIWVLFDSCWPTFCWLPLFHCEVKAPKEHIMDEEITSKPVVNLCLDSTHTNTQAPTKRMHMPLFFLTHTAK